jgi:hypothetical protein
MRTLSPFASMLSISGVPASKEFWFLVSVSARGDSRDGASGEILGDGFLNHRVDGLPVV